MSSETIQTNKKLTRRWAMYDWANSVYNLVITSTMFPSYYEEVTRGPKGDGMVQFMGRNFVNTALYNYALAVAFLVVAVLSPLLSSIADYRGNKKAFMRFFVTLGSFACSMLFFFEGHNLVFGISMFILAAIGFWASLVFYNSYLPEIAAVKDRDKVSAQGFTMGYIGSVLLQLICFVLLFMNNSFGITQLQALQISFLLVGFWWFGFAQIPLYSLPPGTPSKIEVKESVYIKGFVVLRQVWNEVKHYAVIRRFLYAFFFYNMGVQTVMLAATLYGKSELEIPTQNLIIAILLIQLIAIPGAFFMSWLSSKIGNLRTLMIVVAGWVAICFSAYFIPKGGITEFYILAACVGFVMGGIQSLSRSTYAKLMPPTHDTTSYFSFYDVTEKIAIVIGMFSFGYITEMFGGSQRNSVLALMAFFFIGLVLLYYTYRTNKQVKLNV